MKIPASASAATIIRFVTSWALLSRLCPSRPGRSRFRDRVDEPFHLVVRSHTGIQLIADDEGRRGVHPTPQTVGEIGVDARFVLAAVVAALPLGQVRDTDLPRVAPEKGLRRIGRFTIPLILG